MLTQLYPSRQTRDTVRGLYLDDPLLDGEKPLVYGNFLSSLDGRIAIVEDGDAQLPDSLTSGNDLSLFLQLEAQADCVVTHGGYMRALAQGRLGNILRLEDPELIEWRRSHGLPAQPRLAICSNTLDFPMPDFLDKAKVEIIVGAEHDRKRRREWEAQGLRIIETAGARVEGKPLVEHLSGAGCRRIYLAAGPELFESCIADRCLDLLYLTLSCQLIGQRDFVTMTPGKQATASCRLMPLRLILDTSNTHDYKQIYITFQCNYMAVMGTP